MIGPRPWPERPPTYKRWGNFVLTIRREFGPERAYRPGRVVAVIRRRDQ